jgi:hypothetical protein
LNLGANLGKYVTRYVKEHYKEVKVKREVYEKLSKIADLLNMSTSTLIEMLSEIVFSDLICEREVSSSVDFKYSVSEDVKEKLYKIKPRVVNYLFSGGKDSSLALLFTRDFIRDFCRETGCKVYILHVIIPGNSHPLNTFASSYVMEWHRVNYGFEPVYKCYTGKNYSDVFQNYVVKYGLEIGPQRWCYILFKDRVFRDFESTYPKPQLHIDGMSPSDSKARSIKVSEELQLITTRDNTWYYAWHPLYNINLSSSDKLKILEKYEEFKPIVELYRVFGDSLNCVVCPYKSIDKMLTHHATEDLKILCYFVKLALRSEKWRRKFAKLAQRPLVAY